MCWLTHEGPASIIVTIPKRVSRVCQHDDPQNMTASSLEGVSDVPAYFLQHASLKTKEAYISRSADAGRGTQHRLMNPGLQEDLGDQHQIEAMLDRLAQGRLVPGVQAFRSGASLSDGAILEHIHLHERSVLKSTKNLQLQVCSTAHDCLHKVCGLPNLIHCQWYFTQANAVIVLTRSDA